MVDGSRSGKGPQRIGPFEIVHELARGGMGVVYVARHAQLGRLVALKQTLGATLYHLLTDRPPFEGATAMDIVAKVLTKEPAPVRRHRPECDVDLQTIVLKCLEKEPAERYAGAGALADDLARYLGGEPIHGQPPRRMRRLPTETSSRFGSSRCRSLATARGCSWAAGRDAGKRNWGQLS